MRIELGDKVRDVVTGFEGIAIGEHQWLTGCRSISVQPGKISEDGKLSEATGFDEHRLQIIQKSAVKMPSAEAPPASAIATKGGPSFNH